MWKSGCRIWPRNVMLWGNTFPEDAWLILDGIHVQGICVVGLFKTGRTWRYGTISWAPIGEGTAWGQRSTTGGPARWTRIHRRTAWERLTCP